MLKKHGQLFLTAIILFDSLAIAFSWFSAYYLHFKTSFGPAPRGAAPELEVYYLALLPVWIVFMFNANLFRLYQPLRGKPVSIDFYNITKITVLSILILTAATFFYRSESFSRMVTVYFWVLVTFSMFTSHLLVRLLLMEARRRGFNLRHVLIIGSGELGQAVAEKINLHPEFGMNIVGFLTSHVEKVGREIGGGKVLGIYSDIVRIIRTHGIDQLYIALPLEAHDRMEKVLANLGEETVDIKVVPDLLKFMNLQAGVEELDGLPIVNLTESPLYGWNLVVKRVSDIVLSVLAILLSAPVLLLVAVLIKLGSKGPVIFRQERVGLDGEEFEMLKFRSMRVDAEDKTGPVWANKNDDRKTRLGAFLRKTSVDELPQLFNVLKGDMSLVGPRPERPVFVEEFKKSVPQYMLRLKMKAGLTGWAQVNGWRGDTSLNKRIEFDLYYIKNWSLLFDLKIILMTFWNGFVNPHAY
ncbi:MAG: undecaprenyl-phosphate glucose phosphotransferase [Nitrospinaceae bacterium]|nr:undecaprenyl-phosphate glucose phosphotransferase [Nitrospinaceae bacterium]